MSNDKTVAMFPGEDGHRRGTENSDKRRCMGCMELYDKKWELCPHCGYPANATADSPLHMSPGSILNGRYEVGRVLGNGGFGVTYIAWDPILRIKVAIKEYLPSEFSTRAEGQTRVTVFTGEKERQFNDGMSKFIDEAKRLAKFQNESGVVKIFDSFKANGTAYIVMEYLDGETLADRLKREKTIPADEAIQIMMPVIESLNHVHEAGILHRDISPDNIFLTKDGKTKLIDFGAARFATTTHSRSLTVIIKPGYSAEEQYRSRGDQGPHTDVYSVGAVLYKMITGVTPPDALERRASYEKKHKDILQPITKFTQDITPNQEAAIYNAMNVRIEDRTENMVTLAGELLSEEPVKRRKGTIKKIDMLTWPIWAKIGVPTALAAIVTLCVLLAVGVIGPKSGLLGNYNLPDGQTRVPNILGMTREKADKKLEKADLGNENNRTVIGGKIESEKFKNNTILSQNPGAADTVLKGTIIEIVISAGNGEEYVVDVLNYSQELAKNELENLGFKVEIKEKYDDLVAPGAVIGQDPAAGTQLEKGSTVVLTVSKGKKGIDQNKTVTVPSLTGKIFSAAQKEASEQDLYIKIVDTVFSSKYTKDQIISQDPQSGSQVKAGTTVNVVVSLGIESVYVPDVQYRNEQDARNMLGDKNLNVTVLNEESRDVSPGCVIRQEPAAGTSVPAGTTVTVYVSSGYTTSVPHVTGMEESEAREAVTSADLVPNVCYESSSTVNSGYVIRQTPAAGTSCSQNDTVTIVVSKGEEYVEPEAPTLTGIRVASKPNKTTYYIGDSFDSSGLRVEAQYSDGTTKDVTSSCDIDTDSFDSRYAGSCSVRISYSDGRSCTTSLALTIKAPSISLNKGSITVSDKGSERITATTMPSGQSVSWLSDDESTATVSNGTVYGVSAGTTTIRAEFEYNGKTYQKTCTVSVTRTELPKYTVSVKCGSGVSSVSGGGSYTAGTQVQVTAKVRDYYTFSNWKADNYLVSVSGSASYTFTMPESNVTLTAYATENEWSSLMTYDELPSYVKNSDEYRYEQKETWYQYRTVESSGYYEKGKQPGGYILDSTKQTESKKNGYKNIGNWSEWEIGYGGTSTDYKEVDNRKMYVAEHYCGKNPNGGEIRWCPTRGYLPYCNSKDPCRIFSDSAFSKDAKSQDSDVTYWKTMRKKKCSRYGVAEYYIINENKQDCHRTRKREPNYVDTYCYNKLSAYSAPTKNPPSSYYDYKEVKMYRYQKR